MKTPRALMFSTFSRSRINIKQLASRQDAVLYLVTNLPPALRGGRRRALQSKSSLVLSVYYTPIQIRKNAVPNHVQVQVVRHCPLGVRVAVVTRPSLVWEQ